MSTIKWWLGNILRTYVAYPLMVILPKRWGNAFHDWTIRRFWLPANDRYEQTK